MTGKRNDDGDDGDDDNPLITDLDFRMIVASLHDQGRAHVLAGMIEGVTGRAAA